MGVKTTFQLRVSAGEIISIDDISFKWSHWAIQSSVKHGQGYNLEIMYYNIIQTGGNCD